MQYHPYDFRPKGTRSGLRLPNFVRYILMGYLAAMLLGAFFIGLNVYNEHRVVVRQREVKADIEKEERLRNDLRAKVRELEDSEKRVRFWTPVLNVRPAFASQLSVIHEVIPDNLTLERMRFLYAPHKTGGKITLTMNLNGFETTVPNVSVVEDFRTRVAERLRPLSYELDRYGNNEGVRTERRGAATTDFKVEERWEFIMLPIANEELMALYQGKEASK